MGLLNLLAPLNILFSLTGDLNVNVFTGTFGDDVLKGGGGFGDTLDYSAIGVDLEITLDEKFCFCMMRKSSSRTLCTF